MPYDETTVVVYGKNPVQYLTAVGKGPVRLPDEKRSSSIFLEEFSGKVTRALGEDGGNDRPRQTAT
jgi:hypothetical protein